MISVQNTKMQIYDILKERIIYLFYQPGQMLNEKELCAEFNTSRTPVREALLKLQDQRLVSIFPRSGTFVSEIDLLELKDLFVIRQNLDGFAVELAVERISQKDLEYFKRLLEEIELACNHDDRIKLTELDQLFHNKIYSLTLNKPLQEMVDSIAARCARGWNYFSETMDDFQNSVINLDAVYIAMKNYDKNQARSAMESHVKEFLDKIKKVLV